MYFFNHPDNAKHAFEEKRRAADDIDQRLARVHRPERSCLGRLFQR